MNTLAPVQGKYVDTIGTNKSFYRRKSFDWFNSISSLSTTYTPCFKNKSKES